MAELIRGLWRLARFYFSRPSSFTAGESERQQEALDSVRVSCTPDFTPIPDADEVFLIIMLMGEAVADLMCEDVHGHVHVLRWKVEPDAALAITVKTSRAEERKEVFFRTYRPHSPRIRSLGWRTFRQSLSSEFHGILVI